MAKHGGYLSTRAAAMGMTAAELVFRTLRENNNNVIATAKALGISRQSVNKYRKEYEVSPDMRVVKKPELTKEV